MSYKGKFRPSNPNKYKGDPTKVIYRSLWELKFMRWCDGNVNILKWSSEEVVIPYKSPIDNRYHRYFPDFYVKMKSGHVDGGAYERIMFFCHPLRSMGTWPHLGHKLGDHKVVMG